MNKFVLPSLAVMVVILGGFFLVQKSSVKPAPTSFLPQAAATPAEPTAVIEPQLESTNTSAPKSDKPSLQDRDLNVFVLDRKANPDNRRQVLQQLVKAGPARLAEMAAIAKEPVPEFPRAKIPHSPDEGLLKFEKGLRITAIETLDQWAVQGADVLKELQHIRDTQNQQDLVFLAGLAIEGIQEGRPGKSTRFIDQAFDEALNGK